MSRSTFRLLAALPLLACGGSLPHPPYVAQATSALTAVQVGPPPGRLETIPKQPPGADSWVDGEWILRRGRWFWLLGRWVKTPLGAQYAPWVLVRAADGTPYYAPSLWRDAKGASIPAPTPLAFATASGEAVFDPEGDPEETGRNIKAPPPQRRTHPQEPPPP